MDELILMFYKCKGNQLLSSFRMIRRNIQNSAQGENLDEGTEVMRNLSEADFCYGRTKFC